MWKSKDFKCLARSSDYEVVKIKMQYEPIFSTYPENKGKDWYCVEMPR